MNGQNFRAGACGDTGLKCIPGDNTCAIRPNGYCAVIVDKAMCSAGSTPTGRCWVVAAACVDNGTHYDSCDGMDKCIHTCDVAKDQKPYFPNPGCN
jgi:hypothetical protein